MSEASSTSPSSLRARSLSPEERTQAVKPVDAWWTVLVVDPIVLRLLPLVRNVRAITPTGVTVAGGAFGVLAIALFLTGHPVYAGIAYEVRFILDCLDGKLARLRGTTSSFGALLDVLLDVILTTVAYAVVADASIPSLTAWITGLALFEAWSRERRALAAKARPGSGAPPAPRRTRLAIAPSTVDVEALSLFLVPVLAWQHEDAAVILTVALLGLVCLDHLRVVVRESTRQR